MASTTHHFEPRAGDDVVIYINKVRPETFKEGVKIITVEFHSRKSMT